MSILKEKLEQALEAKQNDVKSFIWKYPKEEDGTQKAVKMMSVDPDELRKFYSQCNTMLYNDDPDQPGRYKVLEEIADQKRKCVAELYLRGLESGALCADSRSFPRRLYINDVYAILNQNRDSFPADQLGNISIAAVTNGIPREFERLSIKEVIAAGIDELGSFDNRRISFGFIINMGVYITNEEKDELKKTASDPNKKIPELIKEKLGLRPSVQLAIKPSGLTLKEMRAMLTLRKKKYKELTTDQLNILLNKVLFRLENEVNYHIRQWEERKRQIELVADARNIAL